MSCGHPCRPPFPKGDPSQLDEGSHAGSDDRQLLVIVPVLIIALHLEKEEEKGKEVCVCVCEAASI